MKKKKTVTIKIAVYLILVSVLSNILIFGMNYLITQKNMQKQMRYMAENILTDQIATVEQYFEEIEQIANSVIYNKRVIRFLKEKQDQMEDTEFVYGIGRIYYNTWQNFEMTFYKEGQYNNKYSIIKDDRAEEISDYRKSVWYQKINDKSSDKVIISQKTDNTYENYVVYRIEDRYSMKTVGYLRIELKLSYLKEQILKKHRLLEGTTIYNQEKQMLFYDEKILGISEWEKNAGFQEIKESLIAWKRSKNTGWTIVMAISKEELLKERTKQFLFLLFIVIMIIFLTVQISKKFFSVITGNYRRLMEGMEKVKQGELTVQVESKEEDEISNLIAEFNIMMNKIDELMRSIEGKQALLKEAEIKALQQQINPHFMHNIMETIMGLASEGMDEEIITVSECMSDMLRYNTRMENMTDLRTELGQVKNYVQVLKIRFEDRFEAYYDIDQECLNCQIVKFTLQPLVENAISHGLKNTWEGGIIRIRIKKELWQEFSGISIMIYDNGCGIEEEKKQELEKRLRMTTEKPLEYIEQYKSLGLMNVHLRLRLCYGEKYQIELFSKKDKGTCIHIKIPLDNCETSSQSS